MFSQKWKYHGKPENFTEFFGFGKVFKTARPVSIWIYDTCSPAVSHCINLVSATDGYRPCCVEHFPKSEKSWTRPVFWSMLTQQRTIILKLSWIKTSIKTKYKIFWYHLHQMPKDKQFYSEVRLRKECFQETSYFVTTHTFFIEYWVHPKIYLLWSIIFSAIQANK